ncbi:hypothetical protein [Legionella brunensis]|uniref:Uncharacterized protein n=1 Tax=Legionella brunensis TaxID=29422 RepID=A0A0W0SKM1_9GAMM|nr:hypothetical protein [Legionella brunensis]KTC83796.1 hypothetical protein Lbru_1619 [Legionella brunensis]
MKRIVISLLFFFFTINLSNASNIQTIPDEISVREHWISLTKSYDIETKAQKLGTLYRRFFSLLLTYDFYDPTDVKTATAKARFFSFGAHLDIYDQSDIFIGSVEEKIFTFFPTFEILARDSSTKLARAEMNFWGTKFYIYDPVSNQEMAIMSRPFFRFKNDWTIHVTNRALLDQKNIDSRVLMTVLAVQGEIEDWQKDQQNNNNLKSATAKAQQLQSNRNEALSQQLKALSMKEGLDKLEKPSEDSLEVLAEELDEAFNAENPSTEDQNQSNQERIDAFTSYCLNLVSSQDLPNIKKKAIVTLLNLRLQGHN